MHELARAWLYEKAQIVAVLLGQLHEVSSQRLRRRLHKLLKVNNLVLVHVRPLHDLFGLALVDPREAEGVARVLNLVGAEDAVAVGVGVVKEGAEGYLAEL